MIAFIAATLFRGLRTPTASFPSQRAPSPLCCTSASPRTQPRTIHHGRALVRDALSAAVSRSGSCSGIDATCGRGSDTMTLGRLLGKGGLVHAFDVQASAIVETRARYVDAQSSGEVFADLRTHCSCHADLATISGVSQRSLAAVVYNLGWYPSQDANKTIITRPPSTVRSLASAAPLIAPGGAIIVTAYAAHDGGAEEADAVLRWVQALPTREWSCALVQYPNRAAAPCIHICERLR